MRRRGFLLRGPAFSLVMLVAAPGGCEQAAATTTTQVEFRGAWVHYQDYLTPAAVARTVAKAKQCGLNCLLPLANHPDNLMFRSALQPMNAKVAPGFDPLAALVAAAHAEGLEVHPYFVMLKGSLNGLAARFADHRMLDRDGNPYGDWLCPAHEEVRAYLTRLVTDCLYTGVEGVHLDYIRYPHDARFCYCSVCRTRYEAATGVDPVRFGPSHRPTAAQLKAWQNRPGLPQWNAWRRRQVSTLVKEVAQRVKERRPDAHVSAAAGVGTVDRTHLLRDGATWLRAGLVDFLCPMLYVVDTQEFRMRCAAELTELRPAEFGKLFAGLPAYKLKGQPQTLVKHIELSRQFGFGGVCLFPFEYLDDAAVSALSAGPFRNPAVLPWSSAAEQVAGPDLTVAGFYRLGRLRLQLGDTDGALQAYHAALALDPDHADTLHAMAWALAHEARREEAARFFKRFLLQEPAGDRAEEARNALERLAAGARVGADLSATGQGG